MTHRDPTLPFIPPTLDERRIDALGKLVDILEAERGRPLTRGETLLVHAALGFHDAIERILESDTRPSLEPVRMSYAPPAVAPRLDEVETKGVPCPADVRIKIQKRLEGDG